MSLRGQTLLLNFTKFYIYLSRKMKIASAACIYGQHKGEKWAGIECLSPIDPELEVTTKFGVKNESPAEHVSKFRKLCHGLNRPFPGGHGTSKIQWNCKLYHPSLLCGNVRKPLAQEVKGYTQLKYKSICAESAEFFMK